MHVQVTPWLSHVFRLYDGDRHLEFEWQAGPLPTDDGGMQVITLLIHCEIIMMMAVEFIAIVIVYDDGNNDDYTSSANRNNHTTYIGTTTRRH